jgi:hypothetical protein
MLQENVVVEDVNHPVFVDVAGDGRSIILIRTDIFSANNHVVESYCRPLSLIPRAIRNITNSYTKSVDSHIGDISKTHIYMSRFFNSIKPIFKNSIRGRTTTVKLYPQFMTVPLAIIKITNPRKWKRGIPPPLPIFPTYRQRKCYFLQHDPSLKRLGKFPVAEHIRFL